MKLDIINRINRLKSDWEIIHLPNIKKCWQYVYYAFFVIFKRISTTAIYTLPMAIISIVLYENSHKTISGLFLGLAVSIIFIDGIKQHYLEMNFFHITKRIKSNILSSYFSLISITELFVGYEISEQSGISSLKNKKIDTSLDKLSKTLKEVRVRNTIDIPKEELETLRVYYYDLKNFINESISLINTLGNDFEIYTIIFELYEFQKALPADIEKQFNKNNCGIAELIIADLNKGDLFNLIFKYRSLYEKLSKNKMLKSIVVNTTAKVWIPSVAHQNPLSTETLQVMHKRFIEKKNT